MKCKKCSSDFNPLKPFHRYCLDCIKTAAKCQTCSKIVFPKNGEFKCCGHIESAKRSRFAGMSLESMVYTLEHGVSPAEDFRNHFGDEAYEDVFFPNRS